MASLCEDYLSCSVCCAIYKDPVVLSCSHSFCKDCLQQFWKTSQTQNCPVCRRSSPYEPLLNLALKNVCESHLKERNERRSSGREEICSLHDEKLKLFCFEDQETLCLICRDSEKHVAHNIRPITEIFSSLKETLKSAETLYRQSQLKNLEIIKKIEETFNTFILTQAQQTEPQMKNLRFSVWKKMEETLQYRDSSVTSRSFLDYGSLDIDKLDTEVAQMDLMSQVEKVKKVALDIANKKRNILEKIDNQRCAMEERNKLHDQMREFLQKLDQQQDALLTRCGGASERSQVEAERRCQAAEEAEDELQRMSEDLNTIIELLKEPI